MDDTTSQLFDLPRQASTLAPHVDQLYLFLWAMTIFFAILIAALIIFFALRYRRRREDEVPPATVTNTRLELLWTFIPLAIVMGIFVWGTRVFLGMHNLPEDAMQIDVVGKQWMWKIQHPTGRREINELHVPVGQRVKLKMISQDVIHSFFIPAFRIKQDVLPGRYTYMWFEPTEPGEYHLFCAEYCGAEHSRMVGKVVVMEPAEYQAWLGNAASQEPPALAGERLFNQYGCMSCHGQQGPTLAGLFGQREHPVVIDGRRTTVTVDDEYLRESILSPSAKIVEGFPPIMPSYRGQLSEEQISQLIAYIKLLGEAYQPSEDARRTSGGADTIYGAPRGDDAGRTIPATQPNSGQVSP